MRVIIAQLDIDPQARDAFLTYMATYIDKRRAEQGNVGFHLTAHLDQPARFTMVEQWADDDALPSRTYTSSLRGAPRSALRSAARPSRSSIPVR